LVDVASESKVPGISFWLSGDKSYTREDGVNHVECTLLGQYTDEELWKKIQKRLHAGFRIYSEDDFHTEVLLVMRDDFQKEINEHKATKRALELANARLAGIETELAEYKRLLGTLGSALGKR
jgi:hypothetical protein